MEKKLVLNMDPTKENGRNSEGSFLRAPNGDILFAYSRYNTGAGDDHDPCDIYMTRSCDEGENWGQPVCIAKAADFGVNNLMSVSGLPLKDGSLCFFFLVKEDRDMDGRFTTIGRAVSADGVHFTASRCEMRARKGRFVVNNDRVIRLSDGRIAAPAAMHYDSNGEPVCLVSDDEGKSFALTNARVMLPGRTARSVGMQEPGIAELKNGVIWMWARTMLHCQYECFSMDGLESFTLPEPSEFSSPCSPMSVYQDEGDTMYVIYNPIPQYNGRPETKNWNGGRTPLVIRKSTDGGKHWGKLNVIEDDPERGYCYTAIFKTNDGHLLCAYCRGHNEKDNGILSRLGIMKIRIDTIQ